MSAPLKQPKVLLNCLVSRFVSFSRRGSLRTGEQKCRPRASGSAESLRTPTGSEEKGVPPREVSKKIQGRWNPGEAKALPDRADY